MTSIPYAYEITGRASAIPIALWMTSYEHNQGALDERFSLKFTPIRGAYIAVALASEQRTCVPITRESVVFGRTNKVGWAVARELDELGAPEDVPTAPTIRKPAPALWWLYGDDPVTVERSQKVERDLICGLPNEGYRIFWTHDYGQFQAFVRRSIRMRRVPSTPGAVRCT